MKKINLKRGFILLVTACLFTLPSMNVRAQSGIPIPLGESHPSSDNPRSPSLVPISAGLL